MGGGRSIARGKHGGNGGGVEVVGFDVVGDGGWDEICDGLLMGQALADVGGTDIEWWAIVGRDDDAGLPEVAVEGRGEVGQKGVDRLGCDGRADHDQRLCDFFNVSVGFPTMEGAGLVGADEQAELGGVRQLLAKVAEGVNGVAGRVGLFGLIGLVVGVVNFVGDDAGVGPVGDGELEHGQAMVGGGGHSVGFERRDGRGDVPQFVSDDGAHGHAR